MNRGKALPVNRDLERLAVEERPHVLKVGNGSLTAWRRLTRNAGKRAARELRSSRPPWPGEGHAERSQKIRAKRQRQKPVELLSHSPPFLATGSARQYAIECNRKLPEKVSLWPPAATRWPPAKSPAAMSASPPTCTTWRRLAQVGQTATTEKTALAALEVPARVGWIHFTFGPLAGTNREVLDHIKPGVKFGRNGVDAWANRGVALGKLRDSVRRRTASGWLAGESPTPNERRRAWRRFAKGRRSELSRFLKPARS